MGRKRLRAVSGKKTPKGKGPSLAPKLGRGSARFSCKFHERKKHPKKICIKNFGGTLAGGSRRGLRRPNSLCRCWFSQQNTVHKEFRGGGSKGVLGVGSKVQFWCPISLCLCAFLGLENSVLTHEGRVRRAVRCQRQSITSHLFGPLSLEPHKVVWMVLALAQVLRHIVSCMLTIPSDTKLLRK